MTDWNKTFLAWFQKLNQPLVEIIGAWCHMDRKLWTCFKDTQFTQIKLQYFNPLKSSKTLLSILVNSITVNIRYKQTQYKQKFGIDRSCGGPVRSYGLIC